MSAEKASIDFHYKIEHYKEQYESMDAKIEADFSFVKVFNGGEWLIAFYFAECRKHVVGSRFYAFHCLKCALSIVCASTPSVSKQ